MTIAVRFPAAVLLLIAALQTPSGAYPPAQGFDAAGSDPQAIAIADEVMEHLGGYQNWNRTRFITWRFFGGRLHVWDKWTGDLRFEEKDLTVLMNVHTRKGRAWQKGEEIADPDSLAAKLKRGYEAWINDSYWLVMPYKLKDTGVTLKYKGVEETEDGRSADTLVLTFAGVGVTPQNKYEVWVDKETRLVSQWAFYARASDPEPRLVNPWNNWQKYGRILLSDDLGRGKHTGIAIFDELPPAVFTNPEPVDLTSLAKERN